VIYICISGDCTIRWGIAENLKIRKGNAVLIPAVLDAICLEPVETTELLEVYIEV
jgi:mannose-6-phosphate isomerase